MSLAGRAGAPARGFTMDLPAHPLIFQVNARQLSRRVAAQSAGAGDIGALSDDEIARWAAQGFDAVWLTGAWTTGAVGRAVSAEDPAFTNHHADVLPDWTPADVCGSPYAISDYRISPDFGGPCALERLRERLGKAGLALILDFVPNHTARDHDWVTARPDFYVTDRPQRAADDPQNWAVVGDKAFAFGRDPYFPGWRDTFQLNHRRAATRQAMIDALLSVAAQCDGVRCDMAMLVLSDIFTRTWGDTRTGDAAPADAAGEFWVAAIDTVRARHPAFKFYAEAYWGLEERLRQLGFDGVYHKSLYDRLIGSDVRGIRLDLGASSALAGSVHFLENHDEPRAAASLPDPGYRHAAVALMLGLPGARLIHDGQVEGRRIRHSIHLSRRADEDPDAAEMAFYQGLLSAVQESSIGKGSWQWIKSRPAWNPESFEALQAVLWTAATGARDLLVVNLSDRDAEAHLPISFIGVGGRDWVLSDRISGARYVRHGDQLVADGLYVRLAPHQYQIFQILRP